MEYDYDVIIVGAGPGGLLAGEYAAMDGAKVLIIDKKRELGKPVRCGEATIENVFQDFNIPPKNELISNTVNCMKCYSSGGKKLSVELHFKGYILNRIKFEQYLGIRAKKKGAIIQLNTTVIGLKRNKVFFTQNDGKTKESLTGKIIIGADGVESRIGRWAGIDTTIKPRDIGVCYQYVLRNIAIDRSTVEFYWGGKYSRSGFIWVFPKSKNTANVGIVTIGTFNKDLKSQLDSFISTRAPDSKIMRYITGCVPQAKPPKKLVKDNVMLVGDAAHVALPVTGGGIGHAMISGQWAGEIAGKAVINNLNLAALSMFDKKMNKLRRKIKLGYMLKEKIFKDDDIFELLFGLYKPLLLIYKLSPKFVEKYLLKSIRY